MDELFMDELAINNRDQDPTLAGLEYTKRLRALRSIVGFLVEAGRLALPGDPTVQVAL